MYQQIYQLQEYLACAIKYESLFQINLKLNKDLNYVNYLASPETQSDFETFSNNYQNKYGKSYKPIAYNNLQQSQPSDNPYFNQNTYVKINQKKKSYKPKMVSLKNKQSSVKRPIPLYESMKLMSFNEADHKDQQFYQKYQSDSYVQQETPKNKSDSKHDSLQSDRYQRNFPFQEDSNIKNQLYTNQFQQLSSKIHQQQELIDSKLAKQPQQQQQQLSLQRQSKTNSPRGNKLMQFSFCLPINNVIKKQQSIKQISFRKQRSYSMKDIGSVHNLLQNAISDIDRLKNKVRTNMRTLSAGQLEVIVPLKPPKLIKLNIQQFKK